MAISGINNSYSSYYGIMNQYRLTHALSQNPRYVNAVERVKPVGNKTSQSINSSLNFVKQYNSTMASVMSSANALRNPKGVTADSETVSSDKTVADVSRRYSSLSSETLSVNVEQLAAAQKSVSTGVVSGDAASADMSFTITGIDQGMAEVNVSKVSDNGTARTNRQMLEEAAKQINSGAAGVTAKVITKDGNSSLEVTSKDTGTRSAFRIEGETGAAGGLERASQEAANAQYTVKKGNQEQRYTSSNNSVTLDYGRLNATLKSTGSTTISSQMNPDKVTDAVSELVDNYNSSLKLLNDNADRGNGVMRQLGNFAMDVAGAKTLEQAGITTNKDGTLKLDKSKLKQSLTDNPDLTKSILSGPSGIAQTMFNRASGAMQTSAASLLSNDLAADSQSYGSNYMSPYTRNGAYSMNNYYASGMMMNLLV